MSTTPPSHGSLRVGELELAYTESGRRDAPHRVLMVHGIPTSSFLYRKVQARLGGDIHSVAVDLPGYGRSSKPRRHDYGLENLSHDLGRFKSAYHDDEPIHLVVHDIGGPIGLGWLLDHPREVRTLTILNTTVFLERFRPPTIAVVGSLPLVGRAMIQRMPVTMLRSGMRREFRHALSQEDLAGYIDPYRGPEGRDAMFAMASTFAGYARSVRFIRGIRKRLPGIDVPTQIVFGGADRYCVPPNGRAFAEQIRGSSFEVLPGVGHYVAEEVPEIVAQRIQNHVRRDRRVHAA